MKSESNKVLFRGEAGDVKPEIRNKVVTRLTGLDMRNAGQLLGGPLINLALVR